MSLKPGIEFRRAVVPLELGKLLEFDARVFRKSDLFDAAYWRICESFWMLVDGIEAGCCAFQPHVDFLEDVRRGRGNPVRAGSLYISSTGILPRFQGQGFGDRLKSWQIAYARRNGFNRLITNTRKSNTRMIDLNHKFGFGIVRITPGYYTGPTEATVVMELLLGTRP